MIIRIGSADGAVRPGECRFIVPHRDAVGPFEGIYVDDAAVQLLIGARAVIGLHPVDRTDFGKINEVIRGTRHFRLLRKGYGRGGFFRFSRPFTEDGDRDERVVAAVVHVGGVDGEGYRGFFFYFNRIRNHFCGSGGAVRERFGSREHDAAERQSRIVGSVPGARIEADLFDGGIYRDAEYEVCTHADAVGIIGRYGGRRAVRPAYRSFVITKSSEIGFVRQIARGRNEVGCVVHAIDAAALVVFPIQGVERIVVVRKVDGIADDVGYGNRRADVEIGRDDVYGAVELLTVDRSRNDGRATADAGYRAVLGDRGYLVVAGRPSDVEGLFGRYGYCKRSGSFALVDGKAGFAESVLVFDGRNGYFAGEHDVSGSGRDIGGAGRNGGYETFIVYGGDILFVGNPGEIGHLVAFFQIGGDEDVQLLCFALFYGNFGPVERVEILRGYRNGAGENFAVYRGGDRGGAFLESGYDAVFRDGDDRIVSNAPLRRDLLGRGNIDDQLFLIVDRHLNGAVVERVGIIRLGRGGVYRNAAGERCPAHGGRDRGRTRRNGGYGAVVCDDGDLLIGRGVGYGKLTFRIGSNFELFRFTYLHRERGVVELVDIRCARTACRQREQHCDTEQKSDEKVTFFHISFTLSFRPQRPFFIYSVFSLYGNRRKSDGCDPFKFGRVF